MKNSKVDNICIDTNKTTIMHDTIRGKILSKMNFQMKTQYQEYEDREKEAMEINKNTPSMIARN
jgi:hypothetical protein